MHSRSADDVAPPLERLGAYLLSPSFASSELALLQRAHAGAGRATVVIKRLQRSLRGDEAMRALLVSGARALAKLRVPRVVRCLEVHQEPEPFVVIEYLAGTTLRDLLTRAEGMDTRRFALPILLDVLDGLGALHAAGFVHGAPSARHIMVGDDGRGCLLDSTQLVGPGVPWTREHERRLWVSEAAPEQWLAPGHVDARCDLYVLGGVLWHALAGRPLLPPQAAALRLQELLRGALPTPREAGSRACAGLDAVCMRALERARGERFESAAQLAAALREEARALDLLASPGEVAAWQRAIASLPAPAPTRGTTLRDLATGAQVAQRSPRETSQRGWGLPAPPGRAAIRPERGRASPHPASGSGGHVGLAATTTLMEFRPPKEVARADHAVVLSAAPRPVPRAHERAHMGGTAWREPQASLAPAPRTARSRLRGVLALGAACVMAGGIAWQRAGDVSGDADQIMHPRPAPAAAAATSAPALHPVSAERAPLAPVPTPVPTLDDDTAARAPAAEGPALPVAAEPPVLPSSPGHEPTRAPRASERKVFREVRGGARRTSPRPAARGEEVFPARASDPPVEVPDNPYQ